MTLRIIITGGTDSMADTAAVLGQPFCQRRHGTRREAHRAQWRHDAYSVSGSDALFDLGGAVMASQLMPLGVYVTMNGQCFHRNDIRKKREQGVFKGTAIFG